MRRCVLFEQSFQDFINFKQDPLCIVLDFVTGEANHFDILSIEPLGSNSIFLDTFGCKVWQPIAFHCKFRFRAIKI